jgi:uncharacterized protein (DUF362 family)
MKIEGNKVGLVSCQKYDREKIKICIEQICDSVNFKVPFGAKILLKPNLVLAREKNSLACTHPEFVAAAAEFFIDQGAKISIGDSPGFGQAETIMEKQGISQALSGLDIKLADFKNIVQTKLVGGYSTGLAAGAFDNDFIINLPKVKTHQQAYITLAVKNLFGLVVGIRKTFIHQKYGRTKKSFAKFIVDILEVAPGGISLIDGIKALHNGGPIDGDPYSMGIIGGSVNPVALDTSIISLLNLKPYESPIWEECFQRKFAGCDIKNITHPLPAPKINTENFIATTTLQPFAFNPFQVTRNALKRLFLWLTKN